MTIRSHKIVEMIRKDDQRKLEKKYLLLLKRGFKLD